MVALLVAGAVAYAGVAVPERARGVEPEAQAGITVSGAGSVTAVPDRASFTFGVETRGKTAVQTLADNSAAIAKVIAALKASGVAAADLQTSQVSLSPRTSEDGTTIVGYVASNVVTASLRELGRAGAVVDAAVSAGANTVSGPSLSRTDQDELYRNALRAALADARSKAQVIAAASGVSLGRVLSVVEDGGAPPPVPVRSEAQGVVGVPIEPGTQQVQATVTVIYSIS